MSNDIETHNKKLVQDFKTVISDAEALLKAAGNQAGDEIDELRAAMQANIANAKEHITSLEDEMIIKAKKIAQAGDDYVHEKPYQSMLIAGGVGLVLGLLLSPRCK